MFSNLLREAKELPTKRNKAGKIPVLEDAFKNDPIGKAVAYGVATSHEYDEPNVEAALSFAKNYKWSEATMDVENIEGIDKPVNNTKVFEIASTIKQEGGDNNYPLVVVDKLHGITPQSDGKAILIDGHHRKEALSFIGSKKTKVYKGVYTGAAEKEFNDLSVLESIIGSERVELIQEATRRKKRKREIVPLTPDEREAVKAKYGETECSFGKNAETGKYFCYTHRAGSKEFDSPTAIPVSTVKFISSTS